MIGIGLNVGIPFIGSGATTRQVPYLIVDGFSSSSSGAPTISASVINGDLAVAALLRTGSAQPVLPAGWTQFLAPYGNAAASGILCYQYVTGGALAWPDFTNNTGNRLLWVFRKAEPGPYASGAADTSGTSLNWRGVNGGAGFSLPLMVGAAVRLTVAQTDTTGKQPTPLTVRTSSTTLIVADTFGTPDTPGSGTFLNSYAAEAKGPLDTAAAKAFVEFTIQGQVAA